MYKEYTQLEDMKGMWALYPGSLTISKKKGVLLTINSIKEKWIGKLKRRACIWTTQRCYITKEDESSPKNSLEDLLTSPIIDKH